MAFTYKWEVTGLKTRDQVNSEGATLADAVVQTYWKLTGTDENGREGHFSGATPFTAADVPSGEFVGFSSLTEETVLTWIKAVVEGDETYKAHIDERIQETIDRELVKEPALPWAPEPEVTPEPSEEAPAEEPAAEEDPDAPAV